jgi:hypothetical protein
MRAHGGVVVLVLALGCATPNKYKPGPDAGGGSEADGPSGSADAAPPASPDGLGGGSADLAAVVLADAVSPDVPLMPDAQPVARDTAIDVPIDMMSTPDLPALLANGEKCGSGGACKSGNCFDEICCAQVCGVCQRCVAPSGTCQSIPADQPDNSPAGTCSGTRYCDGEDPPRCLDCVKCSDGACIRNRWNFDSGSLGGARVDPNPVAQSPAVATAPVYQNQKSLAMSVPTQIGSAGTGFYIQFPVCSGGRTANLKNRVFHARVFLETQGQPLPTMPFNLQLYSDKMTEFIVNTLQSADQWVVLEGTLPPVEDPVVLELLIWVGGYMNASWTGRVWVDDVRID